MKLSHRTAHVHPVITTILAAGLAAGLVGCSSGALPGTVTGATTGAAAAQPATSSTHVDAADPCALVTEAEAGAALGADPGPGVLSDQGAEHLCTYGSYPTAIVVASTPTNGKLIWDAAKNVQGHKDGAADIPSLGTAAFGLTPSTNAGSAVYFYKGDAYVSITLVLATPYPSASPAPRVLTMAKAAAARL